MTIKSTRAISAATICACTRLKTMFSLYMHEAENELDYKTVLENLSTFSDDCFLNFVLRACRRYSPRIWPSERSLSRSVHISKSR